MTNNSNQLSIIKNINITFHDDPQEEIRHLFHEAGIMRLLSWLNDNKGKKLPEELKEDLGSHIAYLADMFSANLPDVSGQEPENVLRSAARDIQISRILKERGVARLYRLCRSYMTIEVPTDALGGSQQVSIKSYQTLINPELGNNEPFSSQEEFLGWFSRASHISRSLIFMRFADLDRLTDGLGMPIEDAYNLLLTKPKVIGDVLRDIASWNSSQMSFINPDVAVRLANMSLQDSPEEIEKIEELATAYKETGDMEDMQNLIKATVPAITNLLEEVSVHPSAKEAKRLVQDRILLLPEIIYSWDVIYDGLLIEIITAELDEQGHRYETGKKAYLFSTDSVEGLPKEIKDDLIKRLPIRNRDSLDM